MDKFEHLDPERYLRQSFEGSAYTPEQQEFLRWIYTNWPPGQLADWQIRELVSHADMITNFLPKKVKSEGSIMSAGLSENTYDVRLDGPFRVLKPNGTLIDTGNFAGQYFEKIDADKVILEPGDCMLAATTEKIWLPPFIAAHVENKSSAARLFLDSSRNTTINPGTRGHTTLEIKNDSQSPIILHRGHGIAAFAFHKMSAAVQNGYQQGRYSGQAPGAGATASHATLD